MSTNDEILQVATHELIHQLHAIADSAGSVRQHIAACVAVQALLALRDTVNRADMPEAYVHRFVCIRELCSLPLPPPK